MFEFHAVRCSHQRVRTPSATAQSSVISRLLAIRYRWVSSSDRSCPPVVSTSRCAARGLWSTELREEGDIKARIGHTRSFATAGTCPAMRRHVSASATRAQLQPPECAAVRHSRTLLSMHQAMVRNRENLLTRLASVDLAPPCTFCMPCAPCRCPLGALSAPGAGARARSGTYNAGIGIDREHVGAQMLKEQHED